MDKSKTAISVHKTISILQMIVGIFFVIVFGLCVLVYATDKVYAAETGVGIFIFFLIVAAIGAWLIFLSIKKSSLLNEFRKYVAAISYCQSSYIPDIASSLGISEDVTKRNLELMVKKQLFSNAFIDNTSNCIIIGNEQVNRSTSTAAKNTASRTITPTAEMVIVTCSRCGGSNAIAKGQTGKCDYCGSLIKGE